MTDELPPLDPHKIRVLVYTSPGERIAIEHPIAHLQEWLDDLEGLTTVPMVKGTPAGAATARELFRVCLSMGNYPVASVAALWICLYGPVTT